MADPQVEKKASIRRKRSQSQIDKKECDRLAGLIVRARRTCERCGSDEHHMQWAHIIPRRYVKVRHHLDNAWALDAGCHQHVDNVAHLKMELVDATIGRARYDELWAIARDTKTKVDYHELRKELKAKALELGVI